MRDTLECGWKAKSDVTVSMVDVGAKREHSTGQIYVLGTCLLARVQRENSHFVETLCWGQSLPRERVTVNVLLARSSVCPQLHDHGCSTTERVDMPVVLQC